jgi:hypothetical protein
MRAHSAQAVCHVQAEGQAAGKETGVRNVAVINGDGTFGVELSK